MATKKQMLMAHLILDYGIEVNGDKLYFEPYDGLNDEKIEFLINENTNKLEVDYWSNQVTYSEDEYDFDLDNDMDYLIDRFVFIMSGYIDRLEK